MKNPSVQFETVCNIFAIPSTRLNAIEQSLAIWQTFRRLSDVHFTLAENRRVYIEHEKQQYKISAFLKRHANVQLDQTTIRNINDAIKEKIYAANPASRYTLRIYNAVERMYTSPAIDCETTCSPGLSAYPMGSCMTHADSAYDNGRNPTYIFDLETHGRVGVAVLFDADCSRTDDRARDWIAQHGTDWPGLPVARALVNLESGHHGRVYTNPDPAELVARTHPDYARVYEAAHQAVRASFVKCMAGAGFTFCNHVLDGLSFPLVWEDDWDQTAFIFPYLDACGCVDIDHVSGRVTINYNGRGVECAEYEGYQNPTDKYLCRCCGGYRAEISLRSVQGDLICGACLDEHYCYVDSDGEYYNRDSCVYSEYHAGYLLADDAIYCEIFDDYFTTDSFDQVRSERKTAQKRSRL